MQTLILCVPCCCAQLSSNVPLKIFSHKNCQTTVHGDYKWAKQQKQQQQQLWKCKKKSSNFTFKWAENINKQQVLISCSVANMVNRTHTHTQRLTCTLIHAAGQAHPGICSQDRRERDSANTASEMHPFEPWSMLLYASARMYINIHA